MQHVCLGLNYSRTWTFFLYLEHHPLVLLDSGYQLASFSSSSHNERKNRCLERREKVEASSFMLQCAVFRQKNTDINASSVVIGARLLKSISSLLRLHVCVRARSIRARQRANRQDSSAAADVDERENRGEKKLVAAFGAGCLHCSCRLRGPPPPHAHEREGGVLSLNQW